MNTKNTKKVLPISVVIPAKNEEASIGTLLEDIKKQTYLPAEIILADAKSQDKTREIAESFGVKVIDGGFPGVGRNLGAKAASQKTLFFIDSDIRVEDPKTFEYTYIKFLSKEAKFATGGYKSPSERKNLYNDVVCWFFNTLERIDRLRPFTNVAGGGFMIVNKEAFLKIGGFDENFDYMEDGDLAKRFKKNGYLHHFINEYVNVNWVNDMKGHGDRNPFELKALLSLPVALTFGAISIGFKNMMITEKLGYRMNKMATKLYGNLGGSVKFENPNKPKDREGGYPKGMTKTRRRFYEILQGVMFWGLLLMPVLLGLLGWDLVFVIYLAFLLSYWAFRAIKLAIGVGLGYRRYKEEAEKDWMEAIKEEGYQQRFDELEYIYLCPVYSESMDTLDPSFESFANSTVGADKINVVMAIEEKKQELQVENFKKLEKKYGDKFASMQYYIHPAGIPGEVAGVKGANINWAARHYVKELEQQGKDIHNYLLITCDSDQRVHPKYLSAIMYKYLTAEDPDMQYYATAIHSFENNIWRVPAIIRSQSNMMTMGIIYSWVMDKTVHVPFTDEKVFVKDSFSSYVVNLKTLHDFEYWDPEIANDDTAFYWNAMVRSKGKFRSQEVYLPTYNDAVENETMIKTYVSYYKQQHRWGWGGINVPITWAAMSEDRKNFPWYRKLAMFSTLFEYQVWFLTVIMMFSFGIQIMKWLSPTFEYSVYGANLSNLLGVIFTGITLLNVPLIYYRRKIMPAPKGWSIWRNLWDFAETYLTTINMLTFGLIPFIQAKTEILLGRSDKMRNFYVTDKVEIKKDKSSS